MSLMGCCLTRLVEGTVPKKTYRIELNHGTLVRYGTVKGVSGTQILKVPYRTTILIGKTVRPAYRVSV